ncbi:hypothetical protein RN607_10315 [Demequina capsici]|uniref:Uncharacterized protein n=1 Tax=Demequina capsici TaxID=3075620 RepID=A0AA96FDI6_9MICO|nr:hypothetical protein [Demequina sp. PMTSA13]WNM26591.1 hypothetical protein RN607_10315 [Demequina sp. PMTSA13]
MHVSLSWFRHGWGLALVAAALLAVFAAAAALLDDTVYRVAIMCVWTVAVTIAVVRSTIASRARNPD